MNPITFGYCYLKLTKYNSDSIWFAKFLSKLSHIATIKLKLQEELENTIEEIRKIYVLVFSWISRVKVDHTLGIV